MWEGWPMANGVDDAAMRIGPRGDPDRYVLVKRGGGPGGESDVWRAHHAADVARPVGSALPYAVKMMSAPLMGARPDVPERWMRSVQFVQGRRLPGLCYVYDAFQGASPHPPGHAGESTSWYLVMEWVSGI